jgi:hypothetical protein
MEKQELLEDFKAILEEKMPGHDFSQETVANIGRVIGDAIRSKSDEYEKELRALEEHKLEFGKSEQVLKEDVQSLKEKLDSADSQISKLSEEIEARKSEDAFNARMEEVDATYELSDEDRKVLVAEIQSIGLEDSDFDEYKSKLAVMWAHKNKEYISEQDKIFNERVEAELQKRLNSDEAEVSEASEEVEQEDSVEEVLENTVAEEEVVANNNVDTATEELSLKQKFQQAFARENVTVKF